MTIWGSARLGPAMLALTLALATAPGMASAQQKVLRVVPIAIACDISCQKGLAPRFKVQVQFSQPNSAQLPLCVTDMHHAARLKSMISLSHHIDMVNADQFRKGVRRIAVDRGAAWRLPGWRRPVASGPVRHFRAKPDKKIVDVKRRVRAHGRRPALRGLWFGNVHRSGVGCVLRGLGGGVERQPVGA